MTRLETIAKPLSARLLAAPLPTQRAAVNQACQLAVAQSGANQPLALDTLRLLSAGHAFSPEEKARIAAFADQLDDQYFTLQEAAEETGASPEGYLRVFAQARATAALGFAMDDTPSGAAEAIYEAAIAVGDARPNFLQAVEAVLA